METVAWIILWLPFITFVIIGTCFLSKPKIAGFLGVVSTFACFFLSLYLLIQYPALQSAGKFPIQSSFSWIHIGSLVIEFGILLDGLTLLMLMVVTGIGSLIFLYSTGYMEGDKSYSRYFAYLSFFVFSMLGIVFSNNFIQTFIFWELVGVSSFLLIGFWFEAPENGVAGKKAFLTTRVGDVGMMIGILLLFAFFVQNGFNTFNFIEIESRLNQIPISAGWMTAITICVFMGVMGKSAQVPLHVWLPDAMAGPTPVSALMHAATMVAAGVFLLARLFPFFAHSTEGMNVIAWTGGITCFLAATVAFVQDDIKKILAYSTLSQLGYMVLALGLGSSQAGMFHLTNHAFFKALLFLGAGSLIHAMHTQDIWQMSTAFHTANDGKKHWLPAAFRKMPVTVLTFCVGLFALMGIPPFSGFFSKEEILAVAYNGPQPIFWMATATVFLTAFYSGRIFSVVFLNLNKNKAAYDNHGHPVHETNWRFGVPLLILAVFAAIGGFLPTKDLLPDKSHFHGPHFLEYLSLTLAVSGFILPMIVYSFGLNRLIARIPLRWFEGLLKKKYFFDGVYDWIIQNVQGNIARASDAFERIVIVEGGMNGLAQLSQGAGALLRKLQTGVVQFYALLLIGGSTVLLALLIFGVK